MAIIAIKNVTILTMNVNKEIIENGVVIVENQFIKDIGDENLIQKYNVDQVIDGKDGILMPGMVNTHTHVSMVIFRSLADDVKDRLNRFLFPVEKELVDKEFVYLGAKYGIAEMLLGGVTTFTDMYFFEDQVAHAANEMGIRAVLGETVLNFPSPDSKEPFGGIEYSEIFVRKWLDNELITPAIAPHAPYSLDTQNLQKASQLSKKYNVPLMMHVAEMDYELKKYEDEYKMTPVEYLNAIGILNERFIAAHAIHVTESDINLLQLNNVGIAHNMGANAKGAKGTAPVLDMYKRGMKVGLGSDGPVSGNTLDILTQMGLVGKVHKLINNDRSVFPASEIIEMATIGGARVLNLDTKIGSIEKGKRADLVILETDSVNMQPIYDYYSVIVYSANPSNVQTVMVNGKVLVDDKKLKHVNIKELQRQLKNLNKKVAETAKKY